MAYLRSVVWLVLAAGCGSSSITSSADAPFGGGSIDAPVGAPVADARLADAPGTVQATCPPYQSLCGGQCINTVTDPGNCGGCGTTCTGALVCSGGQCVSGCLPGLSECDHACVDRDN